MVSLWSNVCYAHCIRPEHYCSVDFPWWFDRKISFFSVLAKKSWNDKYSKLQSAIWRKNCFRRILSESSLNWNQSGASGGQTHGWILLKKKFYCISFYSILCRLSPFHREWPQLATILTSFDFPIGTKSKSLTFDMKQAIHGEKDLTCKEKNKNWYNRIFFSRGFIHAFGLQIDVKILEIFF